MALDLNKIDLEALVPTEQPLEDDLTAPLKSTMAEAMKVNPDHQIRINQLSRDSGIPVSAVETDPDSVESNLNLNKIDLNSLAKTSPKTGAYLSNYNNAVIAHDDVPVMEQLEKIADDISNYGADIAKSFKRGGEVVEMAEIGKTRMYGAMGFGDGATEKQLNRLNEIDQKFQNHVDEYNFVEGIPMAAAEQLPIMWDILTTGLGYGVATALPSAGAGAVVAGPAGALGAGLTGLKWGSRLGIAKAAFDLESGMAFNEYSALRDDMDTPIDPKIAAYGATAVGLVNAGLETVSLMALGRTVTPAMRMIIRNRVKGALKTEKGREGVKHFAETYFTAIGTEVTTEALQEFTNIIGGEFTKLADPDAFDEQTLNEAMDNIFSDKTLDRVTESAVKAAQASIAISAPGAITSAVIHQNQQKRLAESEQLQIDEIDRITAESKLKQRDKEAFRQYMDDLGPDTNVFIDGPQVTMYMQDKTPDEIEADPALKILDEQVKEAAATGGDVVVKLSDFATDFTGTDHFTNLRPHLTLSAESVSPFRQEQVEQETRQYVEQLRIEAEENVSEYVEAQDIFTTVRDQLIDTGRVTEQQAKVMAQIVPAWATVQARKQGKSVMQVYADSGLRIEGPMTGRREAIEAEGVKFEQIEQIDPQTQATDFRQAIETVKKEHKFGASVFVYPEEDYQNMQLFMSKDGKQGIAVKPDGDIVSAFSTGGGNAEELIRTAIAAGGTKLDAFDTVLPDIYKKFGFKEVRRESWNEEFKPEGWDKETFKKFNEGEPDVVFMEYDPELDTGREKQDVIEGIEPTRDRAGREEVRELAPLEGAPVIEGASGPTPELVAVAEQYARENGIDLKRQTEYSEVDEQRATRIAEAYDQMEHNPQDPVVKEAYQNLIEQTLAQYRALEAAGYQFYFYDENNDPYDGNPWNAMRDLRNNKVMGIFATEAGFGTDVTFDVADNPLLEDTGLEWAYGSLEGEKKRVLANDLFRAVHDAFGHGLEGAGFRAQGEENAWQAHVRMFTGSAVGALTSETRGQNSWLNFGPYGETNRTAKVEDTVFADQKTGLMPEWTWTEGRTDIEEAPIIDVTQFGQETRGYYEPANSLIRLTEASDLSTFLHEFAHFMYDMELQNKGDMIDPIHSWFRRNAKDVAKEATKYNDDKRVDEDEVTAYLDEGTSGNTEIDLAIERAVHEQFARGFETYLMEGKAPSMELRNVFRTIARWLTQIYRVVRGDLRVDLDQEMKKVFDRLLATEEQIAAADARQQFEPMFTDASMAGMTEAEFQAYKERQAKSKDVAAETLRDKLIKQLRRQTESWWKVEKLAMIQEELPELQEERVYNAIETLKGETLKLDRATVKAMIGEKRIDKRGVESVRIPESLSGMHVPGAEGVHPDQAAAFLGYGSGDELIQDLMTAPKIEDVADARAEARMIQQYGDILNDGSIEKEADEAVQNEERGKLILTELKVLNRGTNRAQIERQTLQSLAEESIGKLSFREIHPEKYRRAEIKAAKESAAALATGDRETAATAKARQALNFYLGRAATEAKNDTLKIVDNMSRYRTKRVKESIMKAGNDYWEQLNKILHRFEFRKGASLKFVDQTNESLNEWVRNRVENDGDGLVLDPVTLDESFVTHWKNIPYSELVGINDSIKNIEHVARYSNKVQVLEEKVDFQKLVTEWVAHMDEAQDTRFKTQRTDVTDGRKWGRWAMAQMTKIPYLASWLDGGERAGMSHNILVQPFTDAYDAEVKLWREIGLPVMRLIQNRSPDDMARHSRKIFIKEIQDEVNDGNLLGSQIIAVALNTGNESNLKKMLLGEGWANPDVPEEITFNNRKLQAVLSHMTESDWKMVQEIWDQMEKLYPQLAEVHRRTTGLTPPKIEATPVVTPFGEFKGGYYPVKYDPNRSFRAELQEDKLTAETESMFGTVGIQASVNASSTNERTGYYAPIRLSLDVVPNHFQESIHYITHHDAVRQTNKLVMNPSVAKVIKEKLGPEEYAQLKPWLNDIAKDGREAPTKTYIDSIMQRLRFGTTLGIMGFSASTGIVQILGLSNTMAEVGPKATFQAIRSILGSPSIMADAWQFAVDNSKVMDHRMQTLDREIKNAMSKLEGKRGLLNGVQEVSMKHIVLMQTYMVDLPSWHAAYIKGMDKFDGDEARAYRYADWVVENIQGSGITKDMAKIMRGQSEVTKMFTMFMTFFSALWNMERDLVKGARAKTYSRTTIAAKLMFLFAIPVFMELTLKGEFGDGEDEDDTALQKYLTAAALYPVASVPFARDIANGVVGSYGYNISPIAQLLESGTRSVPELVTRPFTDEEITTSQIKGTTKLVGAALGVPGVNQVWKTGEHLQQVAEEGEELTLKELLYGPER